LDDVLDLVFLLANCCFKFVSFCLKHGKLAELVFQDLVSVATWFGRQNEETL